MLKALAILLVVATFASCTPTKYADLDLDQDNLMALLASVQKNTKTIHDQKTMHKTICATQPVNMQTCNSTTTPVLPLEMIMAANFERLIAELAHCEDMEMETEDDDEDKTPEQKFKAKLLKVIMKMKTENRPLPFQMAPLPKPTKLQCPTGKQLKIKTATLSNVEEKCHVAQPTDEKTADEQDECNDTTRASELVKFKCDGQKSCILSVDHDFTRVCPCATQKYLDVDYTCEEVVEDEKDDETDEATTTAAAQAKSRSKRQIFNDYYGFGSIYDDYYYGYGGPGFYDYYGGYGLGLGYDYYGGYGLGVGLGYDYYGGYGLGGIGYGGFGAYGPLDYAYYYY